MLTSLLKRLRVLKKETRKAVVSSYQDKLYIICVFRGFFLEKIFFGESKEEVISYFNSSSVKEEVKTFVDSGEEVEICNSLAEQIGRKLNKLWCK